ncbi:hypothetical protein MUK42_33126 [Musa troglodytarum]|uniref:Uncharacterized protein n=1 Tax=Musa troglodytarum TaxID=320322 RepID=A0A9E7HVR8_9LILI|nr:hypothetical protein MUK42_33126 [Musa troglodytarum]
MGKSEGPCQLHWDQTLHKRLSVPVGGRVRESTHGVLLGGEEAISMPRLGYTWGDLIKKVMETRGLKTSSAVVSASSSLSRMKEMQWPLSVTDLESNRCRWQASKVFDSFEMVPIPAVCLSMVLPLRKEDSLQRHITLATWSSKCWHNGCLIEQLVRPEQVHCFTWYPSLPVTCLGFFDLLSHMATNTKRLKRVCISLEKDTHLILIQVILVRPSHVYGFFNFEL